MGEEKGNIIEFRPSRGGGFTAGENFFRSPEEDRAAGEHVSAPDFTARMVRGVFRRLGISQSQHTRLHSEVIEKNRRQRLQDAEGKPLAKVLDFRKGGEAK